ncbi:MAG: serine/threonine-protein kinase [Acidimicrobiales bacterium]
MVADSHSDDILGGRYRLDSVINTGGMAVVWRATDLQLHREVAVKMLKDSVAGDQTTVERFRREAIALARVRHPHIIPVYDCVDEGWRVALVMQLINGQSLRELLDSRRGGNVGRAHTLSVYTTVHVGRAIASALAVVHAQGMVHRDIKPANIMMVRSGEIWLTDFGIAKGVKSSENDDTDLTSADLMMGTAKYLSPEQVQGRTLDGRADIYSLGLVLYECLAGHVPFKGDNDQQVAIARLQRDPTPLAGIRNDVPSTVLNVIHKMLRRKPENRYQSAAEVVAALDDAMAHVHDAVTPPTGLPGAGSSTTTSRTSEPLDPLMRQRVEEAKTAASGNPATAGGNPAAASGNTVAPESRDVTPQSTARSKSGLPRRQRTRTGRALLPVALVVVASLVMGVMLWNGLRNTRSVAPGDVTAAPQLPAVSLKALRSYDPNGDDGAENESQVPALLDNNPATAWTTVCYGDRYFGSKGGVGLVLELSGTGIGTITANFANGPWHAEVYTADTESVPARFEDWGLRVADQYGENPGIGKFDVRTPGRWMLLMLREAGRSAGCSNSNPYKGSLSDLSFTSAP